MTILADSVHICLFLFLLLVLFLGSCRDCSGICVVLFLEGKCLLLPLDVETDLGSTSVDDSTRGVQEWPPRMQRFLRIMLTLEPKSQSASGKSTMPMEIGACWIASLDWRSWIASLDWQKVSNYFHNGVTPIVTFSSISGQ